MARTQCDLPTLNMSHLEAVLDNSLIPRFKSYIRFATLHTCKRRCNIWGGRRGYANRLIMYVWVIYINVALK
ncbi:hypothetical protein J6590_042490 [Homalodisca vitripennis]|nr:hypothetical protein J6590_042490 [Homalodisca vitripennis]